MAGPQPDSLTRIIEREHDASRQRPDYDLRQGGQVSALAELLTKAFTALLRHRASVALLLFVGTWLFGAIGLYLLGLLHGGEADLIDEAGHHPNNFSILNCLFMAAITMSTVGYGDVVDVNSLPEHGRGQVMSFLILFNLMSYFVLVYVSGTVASFLIEGSLTRFLKRRRMEQLLHSVRHHYIVCGCGTTGSHVVDELCKLKKQVVAIDPNEDHLQHLLKHHPEILYMRGDALDDELLREAGVARADGLFASLPNDKDNIVLTLSARQMNPGMRIVSRSTEFENISKLKRVGANAVISPNHIGGLRMASEMVRPSVVSFLDQMLRDPTNVSRFENVSVARGGPADGRTLGELAITHKVGLAVIAVVRANGSVEYNPGRDTRVHGGDAVVVITDPERQVRLDQLLNRVGGAA